MRLARIGAPGAEVPSLVSDGTYVDLRPALADRGLGNDFDPAFFAQDGVHVLREAVLAGELSDLCPLPHGRIGPPIARPGKIVCIGLNYAAHALESGAGIPQEPVVFMKDPSTIVGPFDPVKIPIGSTKTDWEVELALVIGRTARYLHSPDESASCIAGYTASNDVSEREFQLERGGQWDKGKSCETFNPLGPELVSADEIDDPQALDLSLSVNGEVRQQGSTADMIFGVDHLVWYLSQFMVLNPGDVINTGTPAGVALGLPGTPYLQPGDVVQLEISNLGRAQQTFEQATR